MVAVGSVGTPSWTTIVWGITTRLKTISPVSATVFTSDSAIFGGYSPYKVWSGITMGTSGDTASWIGTMRTGCMAVVSAKISVPDMATGSNPWARMLTMYSE